MSSMTTSIVGSSSISLTSVDRISFATLTGLSRSMWQSTILFSSRHIPVRSRMRPAFFCSNLTTPVPTVPKPIKHSLVVCMPVASPLHAARTEAADARDDFRGTQPLRRERRTHGFANGLGGFLGLGEGEDARPRTGDAASKAACFDGGLFCFPESRDEFLPHRFNQTVVDGLSYGGRVVEEETGYKRRHVSRVFHQTRQRHFAGKGFSCLPGPYFDVRLHQGDVDTGRERDANEVKGGIAPYQHDAAQQGRCHVVGVETAGHALGFYAGFKGFFLVLAVSKQFKGSVGAGGRACSAAAQARIQGKPFFEFQFDAFPSYAELFVHLLCVDRGRVLGRVQRSEE